MLLCSLGPRISVVENRCEKSKHIGTVSASVRCYRENKAGFSVQLLVGVVVVGGELIHPEQSRKASLRR